ncbi:Aste57867_7731 [Aphanomyces stellatus]|uniref:Aste57867_7731 protein n=1 Tax=Aphanomyces stellatus TaxID=120398 RepID=A0A485KIQ9_9STRA|nr:hypothetical protein As57867_007702 [Aphanomyces stellatus]VFT84631.1 Aste57867_7731 [Aphanomyces stellatus]
MLTWSLLKYQAAQVESQRVTDDVDMEGTRDPTCDDPEESHVQFDDVEMSPPKSPVQAPNDELLQQSPLELQLVTGNRSAPATKRALSPSPRAGTPLFTSNRFPLLQEDDVELSLDDYISHEKKKPRNEAKKAHRDRAKKFMTDKTAEKSIGECQAILCLEPAVVAHSLYSGPNDSALLNALIASHAVERKMASYKHQGKPSNYRDYSDTSNLSQVGLKCPRAILEAITTSSEDEVLMAVAALDLYLCNRAPDLYTNYEAIEALLGEAAMLWETRLTDRSLIGVVKKL